MEFFIDKANNSFIINLKNFNLRIEIPIEKVVYVKEKLLVKRFIFKETLKKDNVFIIRASNFGINYLYIFEKLQDFVVLTFKLKDLDLDYLIITLPKKTYELLKRNLEGLKEKILNK